jgi:hypothetical protein
MWSQSGEAELKLAEIMSHELEPGDNSAVDDTDQRRHYMIVSDDSDLVLIGTAFKAEADLSDTLSAGR